MAAGEEHGYELEATAGRVVIVMAEQQTMDLELRIQSPEGRELAWVDSPTGPRGREVAAIRPETSGVHRLTVLARNRGTNAGGYRLEALELPEGNARQRSRAAAELATTRAAHRFRQGTRDAQRAAVDEALRALSHWRDAGEEPGRVLLLLGALHRQLDEPEPALEALQRAQLRFEAEGDAAGVASTWTEIGYVHWAAGRPDAARQFYEQALAVWKGLADRYGEALLLNNLGLVDHGQGELRRASERYQLAAGLFQAGGDLWLAALALNNLAGIWDLLGEPQRARDGYTQALELLRRTDDPSQEPRLLLNLAAAHRSLGEIQAALSGYRRALELLRLRGDRRTEASALNSLGMCYLGLGEPGRAQTLLEQALALRRETADGRGEAVTLQNLGLVQDRLGRPQEALPLLRQALTLRETLGDRLGRATVMERLGEIYASLGQPAEALRHFEQALQIRGAASDPIGRGRTMASAAESRIALGEPQRAATSLSAALNLLRAAGDLAGEARALVALARSERVMGQPQQALTRLAEAFERIESLRSRVASPELRASYLAAQRDAYELAVEIRLDLHRREPTAGHDRAALEVSERARARSLLDLLADAGGDLPSRTDTSLAQRRQQLRQRASAKETRRLALLAADAPSPRRQEVERELETVLVELQLVEEEIARQGAEPAGSAARTASAAEIQALVGGGTLLLEYALGERRSVLWVVADSSLEVFELPGREEIEALAARLYRRWSILDSGTSDDGGAAELSHVLLGPIARRLGSHRLVVVPDGALHYLPFAALPRPGSAEPLLAHHEVVTLPSASFLVEQRRALALRAAAGRGVAVLADPVFDPRDGRVRGAAGRSTPSSADAVRGPAAEPATDPPLFDRLALSRREAEAIAAAVRGEPLLLALDFQARRSLVTEGTLATYRILHFATHGTLHAEHPELSGIVLSLVDPAGRPQEGFLRLSDLRALSLAAELVVLSGCQTALGREIRGEGLVGLSRGFLDAGARNVVASLWQVPDRATAELMSLFYRALARPGTPPAAALREAQLAIRARRGWSEPFHWASFIVMGEGR